MPRRRDDHIQFIRSQNRINQTDSLMIMKPQTQNGRPHDATIQGLRRCIAWLDACKEIGWDEKDMPKLEDLWWQYYDKDGDRKPQ